MLAYRAVRLLLTAAASVFFRRVCVVGQEHIPTDGPVLFAGNHPNSLIDPVLLCTTSGRIVHFAAKDKLFVFPMSVILGALGAVPIMRAMDHGDGGGRDNSAALAALRQVLLDGRAVGIFPEGLSHHEPQLQRIRSGAARIALETAAEHPGAGVQVVCCGLHYVHRKSFRSQVLVQYGPPIAIDSTWVARWHHDPRAAASALTEAIEADLRALTVNTEDWDTLRVLDGVRRLYQPPDIPLHHRVELARRFATHYPDVADQPEVVALYEAIADYLDDLDAVGLDDRDLIRGLRTEELTARALSHVARLAVWVPVALPGLPLHLPLLLGVGWAGLAFAPRKDVVGTSRLVLGSFTILAAYVALPLVVAWWWGLAAGLVTACMLPLSGYATLRVLARTASLTRVVSRARAALHLGDVLRRLKSRRAELEARVVATVAALIPDDLEPLYPRSDDSR